MTKTTKIISALSILIALSSTLSADEHDKFSYKPMLDKEKGFLKYEDSEKGQANARLWLERGIIVLEFLAPAWNLHGVEAAPDDRSDIEKEQVNKAVKDFLNNPQKYFTFRPDNDCLLRGMNYRLEQVEAGQEQSKPQVNLWRSFDVRSEMLFGCKDATPETIVMNVFSAFPRIKQINLQVIANNGDLRRIRVTPEKTAINITRPSS